VEDFLFLKQSAMIDEIKKLLLQNHGGNHVTWIKKHKTRQKYVSMSDDEGL